MPFFAIAIPRSNNTKTMASIGVVTWDNHFSIYIADHAVAEASDVDQLAAGKEGEGTGWGGEPAYRSQPIYYL
jgi:hypothetical protein